MGTGLGSGLMPPLLVPYIAEHGWRAGYIALAATVAAAVLPIAWLITRRGYVAPTREGGESLRQLARRPAFRLLAAIFFLASFGALGTVVHLVPMLGDAGLSPARTGLVAGVVGIAVIAGRIGTGLLLDRFPAAYVTAGLLFASAGGMSLLGIGGADLAFVGALAIGLAIGAEIDLLSYLTSRLLPAASYGTAYGGLYGCFLLGAAIGPVLTGFLFDATGGYTIPLLLSSALLACAGLLALRLRVVRRGAADPAATAAV